MEYGYASRSVTTCSSAAVASWAQLRIAAAKAQAEFTWIRPGVSFESLQPERGARQPLGRIDRDESLLLISASGERSQVVRVRQD